MAYKGIAKSSAKPSKAKRNAQRVAKAVSDKYKSGNGKYSGIKSTSAPAKKPKKSTGRTIKLQQLPQVLVEQPPETPLSRKGLTLRQILRNTPRLMHENAKEVQVVKFKRTKTKSGLPAVKATVVHNDPFRPDRIKRPREVYIIGLESTTKPISKQRRVMMSCGCENFVFTWEYALAVHGAARIMYGNGQAPDWTNPHLVAGTCKHCTAIAMHLITKGI